jgi:serine phosphatase RsbU (regulator of sigma subunit)
VVLGFLKPFFLLFCNLKSQFCFMHLAKVYLLFIFVFFCNSFSWSQVSEEELVISIAKNRENNNLAQTAASLNKLGFFYWENNKLEKALAIFEQSVAVNKEIGNVNAIKALYSIMGIINSDLGQIETALVFFRKSIIISRSQHNSKDLATTLINIGSSLLLLNRADEAIVNLTEAMDIALELNDKTLLKICYQSLSEAYEKLGNTEKTKEYFKLYSIFQKELQKEELELSLQKSVQAIAVAEQKALNAINEKLQTEKMLVETQDSLKRAEQENQLKELALLKNQADLKIQRLLSFIYIAGMGFLAVFLILILRSNNQKRRNNIILENRNAEIKKQNREIKEQNLKISQSINYARNIQGALLPPINSIKDFFSDSFIFFSPRDVVSGDFYWFSKIPGKDDLKIIAAIDCTGHGVPGAFMSMLGISFMEEIVIDKGIFEPKTILETMHSMIKISLNQETTGNFDGMDAAICLFDEKARTLTYAGAVNPLIIIQNGELTTIRGNFFGIGGTLKGGQSDNRLYDQHTIEIGKDAVCYIYSDGFADQFGGKNGKKFFSKNFVNYLHSIHKLPFVKQKELLAETLREWHGTEYQRVDDVLVIGFRL